VELLPVFVTEYLCIPIKHRLHPERGVFCAAFFTPFSVCRPPPSTAVHRRAVGQLSAANSRHQPIGLGCFDNATAVLRHQHPTSTFCAVLHAPLDDKLGALFWFTMIIDGVKMACEACIRGHRVSGCNHHGQFRFPFVHPHCYWPPAFRRGRRRARAALTSEFEADDDCDPCTDRKLLPIAKKGRPVSQCNHCRSMRKSRSAHVKCDCGERIAAMKEQAKNGIRPAPLSAALGGDSTAGNGVGIAKTPGAGGGGSHAGVAVAAAPSGDDSKSELAWPSG
jgi:hypothetical protein